MKKLLSIFALLILIHSISKTQTYFLKDKKGTIIISHKVSNFDTLLKIDSVNLLNVPGTPAQKLQALTNWPDKVILSQQDVISYNFWGTKATEKKENTYISSADGKNLKKSSCQELIRKRPAYEIVVIYLCMIVIGCILSYYKNNQKKAIAYISIALIGLWLSLGLGLSLGLSLGLWLMIGFGLLIGIGFGIVIGSLISMGIQIGIEFGILIGIGIGIGFGIVIGSLIGIGIEIVIQDIFFLIIISLLMYSLSYFITQYVTKKIQPAV